MEDVSKRSGRTVLFVSHNMESVKKLCTKTLLMENGKITKIGNTNEVIEQYLNFFDNKQIENSKKTFIEDTKKIYQILSISILDNNKNQTVSISRQDTFTLAVEYSIRKPTKFLKVNISIAVHGMHNNVQHGTTVLQWSEQHYNKYKFKKETVDKDKGSYRAEIDIPGYLLNSGQYMFSAGLEYANNSWYELMKGGIIFELFDEDFSHNLKAGRSAGVIAMPLNWRESKLG